MEYMEPNSQLTPEEYSLLKELWKADESLIKYPFPVLAICKHEILWEENISPYIQYRLESMGFDLQQGNK